MARYHGRHGQLTMNGTLVVGLSKWQLDLDTDVADCTAFGDKNKVSVQGLSTRKGSFSGFLDSGSIGELLAAVDSLTPNDLVLVPTTDADISFAGPAWVNLTVETDVKDAVKVSGKFDAADAWTTTAP